MQTANSMMPPCLQTSDFAKRIRTQAINKTLRQLYELIFTDIDHEILQVKMDIHKRSVTHSNLKHTEYSSFIDCRPNVQNGKWKVSKFFFLMHQKATSY